MGGSESGAPIRQLRLSTGRLGGVGKRPRIPSADTPNRNAGALNSNEYPSAFPFKAPHGWVCGGGGEVRALKSRGRPHLSWVTRSYGDSHNWWGLKL